MKPIKYSINFFLNKKEGSSIAPLRFRIVWGGGQRLSFNVGYSVNIDHWNQDQQQCTKKSYHGKKLIPAQVINRTISTIEDNVAEAFAKFEEDGICPTKEQMKEYLYPDTNKNKNTIQHHFKEFISYGIADGWSEGMVKKMRTMAMHLKKYNANLTFKDIESDDFFYDIVEYFQQRNIKNDSTNKYIRNLQWFCRWAKSKGYTSVEHFITHKSKLKVAKKPIIFLTWEELMKLYNYDFSNHRCFDAVRDCFCFSCFTSLRYSDVRNLKRTSVTDNAINVTTIKTSTSLTIELNKYSKAILDKYKDDVFANNMALPVISSQRTNEYLKEILKLIGIDEPITLISYKGNVRYEETFKKHELITFHAGRRTFVSNAIMLGIPANIVMKWTGHSDYKAMIPYIEMADEAKRKAMTIFDNI